MSKGMPRVSIGLPVHNGEKYLRESLDSLLAQTYTDFELIISDNASTDRTDEICRAYAARDSRIRYYRNEKNFGPAKNFNRTFELAKGEYFKWATHDDVIAPTFLEKCVHALEDDKSAVLAHPKTRLIDEESKVLGEYVDKLQTGSADAHKRFHSLIAIKHSCFRIFGVMRSDVLKRTRLITAYTFSDRWLLAHLGLLGRFVEVPEYLFCRRSHQGTSWDPEDPHSWNWWNPSMKSKIRFPFLRKVLEYSKAIENSSLRPYEKMMCYTEMARWIGSALGRAIMPRWQAAFQDSETLLPRSDHHPGSSVQELEGNPKVDVFQSVGCAGGRNQS